MADITMTNGILSVGINKKGAELKSIKKIATDTEYLWCADPAFWNRTSPVLFPFVGMPKGKEYVHEGVTYPMGQHGFARDMEFEVISQTEDTIWFALSDDENTRKVYPFRFCLEIGYQLVDSVVKVLWKVTNPDEKTLYFAIGAHPAFNIPLAEGDEKLNCSIRIMDGEGNLLESYDDKGVAYAGMACTEYERKETPGGLIRLTEDTFAKDTLIIEKEQVKRAALVGGDGKEYLAVEFDSPLVGIWSPKVEAPFICIEPWYGRCDDTAFEGEIKDKAFENALAKDEVFEAEYKICIL